MNGVPSDPCSHLSFSEHVWKRVSLKRVFPLLGSVPVQLYLLCFFFRLAVAGQKKESLRLTERNFLLFTQYRVSGESHNSCEIAIVLALFLPLYNSESSTGDGALGCNVSSPLLGLSSSLPKQESRKITGHHVKKSKRTQQGKICWRKKKSRI